LIAYRALYAILGALCAVLCAFAVLLSLSDSRESLKFCLYCAFGGLGIFLLGAKCFNALVSDFRALDGCTWLGVPSVLASLGALVPSVMRDPLRVYPLPYFARVGVRAVLRSISYIKNMFSKTLIVYTVANIVANDIWHSAIMANLNKYAHCIYMRVGRNGKCDLLLPSGVLFF
jgi:hypothetical protein